MVKIAKNIMVQGTMSNVGKSMLVTALCRLFKRDGYKVAPFKSQNMALNSFVTKSGGEMGRAQVVQAEAAGIEPDVRMNPILLKPTTDTGSQVIVNGKVIGNMKAAEYFECRESFIPTIMEAYESLAAENDIIVIEGAGSPAEVNLNKNDIVNMGLAQMVDAPVLLVGDIDRGGVFAQLYGTMMLMPEDERARIRATVVNKFRGDRTLFEDGVVKLRELCGVPVAGVLPYVLTDIDDEDSLTERFRRTNKSGKADIAVIRLPRISNISDFTPFERFSGVTLRYVGDVRQLGNPDLIIIPGTKSTISDLLWLRNAGMEKAIREKCEKGTILFGVCGGYQMLGSTVEDPIGAEAACGTKVKGMGVIDAETRFGTEKQQRQCRGILSGVSGRLSELNGHSYTGYEIHMGTGKTDAPVLDGKDNIYGTYVHGFFDEPEIANTIVSVLYKEKGFDFTEKDRIDSEKQRSYDFLADTFAAGMEMELIYRILNREA